MFMIAAVAGALAAAPTVPSKPQAWELDYYRLHVRSGAQCVYANGDRAALLRTETAGKLGFLIRTKDQDTVVPIELDRSREFRFEANGGVTMYHMIRLAVGDLLGAPTRPVSGGNLDAFLTAKRPAACRRKTFEADLYDR